MTENQLAVSDGNQSLSLSVPELVAVLKRSLYPGAADDSVKMVIQYCTAAKLDVMQKPVHIVPIWNSKEERMVDVVMPGIGLYRTQAARSGALAGIDEPEFGPDVKEELGGKEITYPAWCKVSVRRRLPTGEIGVFTGKELWKENYATAKKDTAAPNAMWSRRPYAQLAKCAQAQALRQAFPEMCSAPTAEEMEGREHSIRDVTPRPVGKIHDPAGPLKVLKSSEPVTPWQDLYPTGWESYLAAQQGGTTLDDSSDKALGKLWAADRTNPALCAWAAHYIARLMDGLPDMEWPMIMDAIGGLPDNIEDCTPEQLWVIAAYLRKARAAQDKLDAQEGRAE